MNPTGPAPAAYQRNLPHIEKEGRTYFVTFATRNRRILPDEARSLVLRSCLHDHGRKIQVHGVVIMPDHVHLIFTPLSDSNGVPFRLAVILQALKGASAHQINRLLNREGDVWQDESFDRMLRSDEKIREKVEYICANPVRKGIVRDVEDYPWLWREWIEGQRDLVTGEGACAPRPNPDGRRVPAMILLMGILLFLSIGVASSKADDGDWQQWTDLSWTQTVGSGVDLGLRWEGRFEDNFSEFAYAEVEPMLNWRYSPRWDFALSYERDQRIEPMDEAMNIAAVAATVRIPRQPWRLIPVLDWRFSNRSRMDFMVPEDEAMDWRPVYRNRTDLEARWRWGSKELVPFLFDEWFADLDQREFTQNRFGLGLGVPIVPHWMARLYWMRVDEKANDSWEWHSVVGAQIETQF